jgi:hypothetical protein
MSDNAFAAASGGSGAAFFNSETTVAGLAFERAWRMIQISREPILAEYGTLPDPERLARLIFDLAQRGERNPDQLRDRALAALLPSKL